MRSQAPSRRCCGRVAAGWWWKAGAVSSNERGSATHGRRLPEPRLRLQAGGKDGGRRRLVAQCLHDAHDAVAVQAGADQRLDHPVLAQHPGAERVDLGARRHPVLDQLLEQGVVVQGLDLFASVAYTQ